MNNISFVLFPQASESSMNFNISKMVCTPLALIKHIIKILHNLCLSFLLGITAVRREIENNTYAKLGGRGTNKVHYGRCASGVFSQIIQFTQAIHTFNSDRNRHNSPSIPRSPEGYSLQQSIQGGSARKGYIKEQGIHELNYVKALENLSFTY